MSKPIEARLPCCGRTVLVTGRRSKQLERPRQHACRQCGLVFQIQAANGQAAIVTKAVPS